VPARLENEQAPHMVELVPREATLLQDRGGTPPVTILNGSPAVW
jgi:hypothetical protein